MTLSGTLAWKSLDQTARNDVRLETRRPDDPDDPDDDKDEVTVSGEKRWDHGDRPEGEWPDSVLVYIYADGKLVHQQLVSAENAWKYSVTLPKYDGKTGKKIVYTVGEEPVPGYELTVEGFDLVNTYVEVEATPTPEPTPSESGIPAPTPAESETPTPTPEESQPPAILEPIPTPGPGIPKTGDTNELWVWLAVTISGALGLLGCVGWLVWKKRRYTGKRLPKK